MADEFFLPRRDPELLQPCRIAGHFPWLPPTPKPLGGPIPLRDSQGRIDRPPPRIPESGSHDIRRAPTRRVVHELPGRMPGEERVYTLECGHKAYRRLRMSHTRCAECPAVPRRTDPSVSWGSLMLPAVLAFLICASIWCVVELLGD